MDESIQKVRQHYDQSSQMEWERLKEHPFEFLLTTYMMEKHVRPEPTGRAFASVSSEDQGLRRLGACIIIIRKKEGAE